MDPDFIPPMTGPNIEEIRTVDGGCFRQITYPDGKVETVPIEPPLYSHIDTTSVFTGFTSGDRSWGIKDYGLFRKYYESEEKNVDIITKKSYKPNEHIVVCSNKKDLSTETILKTLSAIKGRLMMEIAPIHIKSIECSMTPLVRQTIINASKRLKMYGKKRPIIARFDELGNRLPDEIDLDTSQGVTLKIINSEDYGEYYLELKGISFSTKEDLFTDIDDLPF